MSSLINQVVPETIPLMLTSTEEVTKEKNGLYDKLAVAIDATHLPKDSWDPASVAFLIEGCSRLFEYPAWKHMIEEIIRKLNNLTQEKASLCDTSYFLDTSIRNIFLATLESRIVAFLKKGSTKGSSEVKSLLSQLKIYSWLSAQNDLKHQKGEPVYFGGIPKEFIPRWFFSDERIQAQLGG